MEGLARALGVTRVARVTGLDRAGVEVACAVRPGGHVLQVTNGKGLTFREAARGALCEAAELWCAERPEPGELSWSDDPRSGARIACRAARDLATGEPVHVPAAALHVPPQGGPLLGLGPDHWTSNGMGAHPRWEAALLHALLEAVERDQLARALPQGWTEEEVHRRQLAAVAVAAAAPEVARLVGRLRARGFGAHLFDLAPRRGGIGVPVAAALLFDAPGSAVPLAAGYACRLDLASALHAALLEAAQSRLTDIHGAREDVAGMAEGDVERLRRACAQAGRAPSPRPSPPLRGGEGGHGRAGLDLDQDLQPRAPRTPSPAVRGRAGERAAIDLVLDLLRRASHDQILALDLAPPHLPVRVAKVIVPGLLLSGLL